MTYPHRMGRTLSAGVCAVIVAGWAAPSAAKDTKRACTPAFAAYKEAARQLKAGHVRDARDQLRECAQSGCASLLPKCAAMNEKITSTMPSVIPVVTNDAGEPETDIQVRSDGQLLTSKLDGLAVPVEPGVHEFTFANGGGVFATQRIMILAGQHDRPLPVTRASGNSSATATAPKPPAPRPAPAAPKADRPGDDKAPSEQAKRDEAPADDPSPPEATAHPAAASSSWALPRSPFPYVLGGVSLAAVGAGALFTVWGNRDNTRLQSACSPECNPASLDHIRTMYVAADISFGVGLAGLAVTTWLFAGSRAEASPEPKSAAVVEVHPTPSGAFASVSGAF